MRTLLSIKQELEDAEDHLREVRAAAPTGREVYRATPGCTIGCEKCDVKCAVLTGEVYHLSKQLEAATDSFVRQAGSGCFYVAYEGTA